jgi:DNA-binding CsgD family transcriptional regulator
VDLVTHGLGERDRLILRGLLADLTADELAHVLDVPLATVRSDVKRIYRELGAKTRPQLAAIAVREGWVSGTDPELPRRDGAKGGE